MRATFSCVSLQAKCDFIERAKQFHSACGEFEEEKQNEAVAERAMRRHLASDAGGMSDPDLLSNLNRANDRVGLPRHSSAVDATFGGV